MVHRRHLLVAGVLGVAGSLAPRLLAKPPATTRSSDLDADLDRLRKQDPKSRASREVMQSARRVFEELSFVGLDTKRVRERLGPPHKEQRLANRPVWRYSYHDGEQGVFRNLWFDLNGREVWGVEPVPTQ